MLLFDQPIEKPAEPPKAFPIVWIRNLQINATDPNAEGSLYLEILPMATDRELLYSAKEELTTAELYKAMQEVPELAAAFAAILGAVKPFKAWIQAQEQLKNEQTASVE